nr:hypothetical protein [Rhodococcus sp. 15-649-1-2]
MVLEPRMLRPKVLMDFLYQNIVGGAFHQRSARTLHVAHSRR